MIAVATHTVDWQRIRCGQRGKRGRGSIYETRAGRSWRIDPDDVVISSNLELRRDGLPRSGQRAPDDPGVAVYFVLDGRQQVIALDVYDCVQDNLAAVAATLSAMRTIERHGGGLMERAFTGFAALPSPDAAGGKSWQETLGVAYDADINTAMTAYKRLRSKNHPDKGGDPDTFRSIVDAWAEAQHALIKTDRA